MGLELKLNIPSQSVLYLLVCFSGVAAFILLGIYPNQRKLVETAGQIAGLEMRIEEQKVLHPFYIELLARAQSGRELQSRQQEALLSDKVDEIPSMLREIADRCNLDAVSVMPDIHGLSNGSGFLPVHVVVKGDFLNFRKFLLELERFSCVRWIEEIQIHEEVDGKEMRLKLSLAVGGAVAHGKT
jgi:hypothetical protein